MATERPLHLRMDYREPTSCGLTVGDGTVNPSAITCPECLRAAGYEYLLDDRTIEQKESDLAAELWRRATR